MSRVVTRCGSAAARRSIRAFVVAFFFGVVTLGAQATQPAAPPKPAPSSPKPSPPAPKPAPAPVKGNAEQSDLPSARSIIDRHVQAIGGRAAILSYKSTHMTGTVPMPANGISGPLDIYSAAPDKSLVKINLGGIGDIVEAFDGTNGWSLQPMTGPMLKQGKELAEKKFDTDFYGDLHEPERYSSMKTLEKVTFDGRPCYKVSLVRKDGGEDTEYYDVATGLRAGTTATRETPMGAVTATQTVSDYKRFGRLLLPTTMKQTAMGIEQVLKITSVEFDNVPPSTFEPPAQIKALIK